MQNIQIFFLNFYHKHFKKYGIYYYIILLGFTIIYYNILFFKSLLKKKYDYIWVIFNHIYNNDNILGNIKCNFVYFIRHILFNNTNNW